MILSIKWITKALIRLRRLICTLVVCKPWRQVFSRWGSYYITMASTFLQPLSWYILVILPLHLSMLLHWNGFYDSNIMWSMVSYFVHPKFWFFSQGVPVPSVPNVSLVSSCFIVLTASLGSSWCIYTPRKLCLWWVYCFHVVRPCVRRPCVRP